MREDPGMFLWAAGLEEKTPRQVLLFSVAVHHERLNPTRLTKSGRFGPIYNKRDL